MNRLIAALLVIAALAGYAADKEFYLSGRIKESTFKTDLIHARIILYDAEGNPHDTIKANKGYAWRAGAVDTLSEFYFDIPRVDSTYTFDVECDGYKPQTVSYTVDNIGKRETSRRIPIIYMERAPHVLKEVTVTTSKIKFYNKGDTLVYNADAFQLAEGSMLDALISQLPGVELSNNGQIKVNGEFVESLLLNGKEFMDGNNNLMLENIAAYTVKDVQVYEGQTQEAKRQRDETARKVLTMDVKLKKEYNMGWLVNAQAGYGTEDRYTARLFASWFNPTTRISLIGNVNNLNDNRQPGRNDTWTPEQLPTGTKEYRSGGLEYNYQNPEETRTAQGMLLFAQTVNNSRQTTARTNFLPGGDTYDNSFSNSHMRETSVRTSHTYYSSNEDRVMGININGRYETLKNVNSDLAGTFAVEQEGITADILDALYSSGTPEQLEAVINRSKTRLDGWHRTLNGAISPHFSWRLPKSNDHLYVTLRADYTSDKEHEWRDYSVNYGNNPTPADVRRQYIDKTPSHEMNLGGSLGYRTSLTNAYVSVNYGYTFTDKVMDSYMYALERLADMGVYGVLPANYLDSYDPGNSFTSHTFTNRHSINPSYMFNKRFEDKGYLMIYLRPQFALVHRHLNYWRNNLDHRVAKTNFQVNVGTIWDGMIEYQFNYKKNNGRGNYRNSVRYSYRVGQELPDLVDMVDVVDNSNPLNIYYGNPDLRQATTHRHLFRWSYKPHSSTLNNILYVGFTHISNSLVRGYTYDTSTGVRYNRMYNVDGNHTSAVTNELNWQFGSSKQFTLSSESDVSLARYADMIGIDRAQPEPSKVDNNSFSEKLRLWWNIGAQTLSLRCDYTHRHTTSTQAGFNTIDADHVIYGLSGVFKLPAGFGINTDFMCYTRRGYGSDYLDTTDPVWNVRATYCPPAHKRWVFIVDGFDLLHKLSNVNYAVSATGRTISYTNTIPRYVMFSVQYRFNIQPKKR